MGPQILLDKAGLQETHDASGVPLPPRGGRSTTLEAHRSLDSPGPQGLYPVSSPAKGI